MRFLFSILLFLVSFYQVCFGQERSPIVYKRYTYSNPSKEKKQLTGYDIEIFRKSRLWEVAKAVYEQDTTQIKKLLSTNRTLITDKDPTLSFTLLHWAVFNDRYFSALVLLRNGANPNLPSLTGNTPIDIAASYEATSEYLILLLKYGGNPNIETKGTAGSYRPLYEAAKSRLESVKILVKAGADVNSGYNTALFWACTMANIDIVKYLIMEAGADYKKPVTEDFDNKPKYAIEYINEMNFPVGSKEEKMKMEVIYYVKKHKNDK